MLMFVLGIDTSCDDTSVALLDSDNRKVLAELVSSQTELHSIFGGVVPEIAARKHLEYIIALISETMEIAGIAPDPGTIDLIAATRGPGLIGGLLVGLSCAKALSFGWEVPFVGVNHLNGHLVSAELSHEKIKYPHIAMVVSGGHSEIYKAHSNNKFELLGETRDDAAGELLDKVGRLLELPFPSGAIIDKWALEISPDVPSPDFPRPLIDTDKLEFSFSGLKTACLYFLRKPESKQIPKESVGAEVLRAAVDCLLTKGFLACRMHNLDSLVISGGVSASGYLRKEADKRSKDEGLTVIFSERKYSTDNAAMIALAGYYRFIHSGPDSFDIDCESSLAVD